MFTHLSRRLIRASSFKNPKVCGEIRASFILFYDGLTRAARQSERDAAVSNKLWGTGRAATGFVWGRWAGGLRCAEPSAHMRETYLCICFYEANKKPPLSLAQLPPWLIYVRKFTPHCSIGEAGRWPGVCAARCVSVCVCACLREPPQLYMMNISEAESHGWSLKGLERLADVSTGFWVMFK